ncbi:hypothetical protein C8R46DRAFT_1104310, partial [Mycena filopes]
TCPCSGSRWRPRSQRGERGTQSARCAGTPKIRRTGFRLHPHVGDQTRRRRGTHLLLQRRRLPPGARRSSSFASMASPLLKCPGTSLPGMVRRPRRRSQSSPSARTSLCFWSWASGCSCQASPPSTSSTQSCAYSPAQSLPPTSSRQHLNPQIQLQQIRDPAQTSVSAGSRPASGSAVIRSAINTGPATPAHTRAVGR